jgi:hypothetical protein
MIASKDFLPSRSVRDSIAIDCLQFHCGAHGDGKPELKGVKQDYFCWYVELCEFARHCWTEWLLL